MSADRLPEVAPVTREIDQPRVDAYAVAARDPNPIHTDAAFAVTTPFERPIAHGMLVLALVSEAMAATFGGRWATDGSLRVRWRAPAVQPTVLTASAEASGVDEGIARYDVRCVDESGTLLLSGTASVRL